MGYDSLIYQPYTIRVSHLPTSLCNPDVNCVLLALRGLVEVNLNPCPPQDFCQNPGGVTFL